MLRKISKYFNLLTILSLVFFGGSIWMISHNETSTGMTMGRLGNGGMENINGYGVLVVGLIFLVSGILWEVGNKEEKED